MGTYGVDDNDQGLVIYAPTRDNNGDFDRIETFDEETYQTGEKTFVVMSGQMGSGEYVALPNIQMATYDVMLTFLVYIDNPISEIIRLAIEEVRDGFIGNIDTIEINEIDLEDDELDAELDEATLKLVTNADGIDFGSVVNIKGKKYLDYSLTISMNVSKNVDFGNQVKWCLYKIIPEDMAIEPEDEATFELLGKTKTGSDKTIWECVGDFEWTALAIAPESVDYEEEDFDDLPEASSTTYGETGSVLKSKSWVFLDYDLTGITVDYDGVLGNFTTVEDILAKLENDYPVLAETVGTTARETINESPFPVAYFIVEGEYDYYEVDGEFSWEYVSYSKTCTSFIPLIASWSTNQDVEAFQTLRPYVSSTEATINRAKEVHNYVKSRGFGTAFTFLLDTTDDTIKDLFIQTFKQQDEPPIYNLKMQMQTLNALGAFANDTDLTFERTMIYGEAQVGDISYGEPIIFAIGFIPSAKDE
jgi:hypothetical protein